VLNRFEQLTISVDGLEPFHDRVRGSTGLLRRLRTEVLRLRAEDDARRVLLRVNTILMRDNIADFGALCEELATWGIDEVSFNQLGGKDRPAFYPDHRLQSDQLRRFVTELPELRRRMRARGLRIVGTEQYLKRIEATTHDTRWPIVECHPGRRFLFIDERGRIAPCSFTADSYGVPIEEIRSIGALTSLAERFDRLRRAARSPACEDCHATHVFDKFQEEPNNGS
jgi:radical SAM protein with 4Fe4S-binding SPASM domain